MSIIQGNAHQASTRGFYPKVINGSLRFNDDDSAYLSWTPNTPTDNDVWAFSCWFKLGEITKWRQLLMVDTNASDVIYFNNVDQIRLVFSGTSVDVTTTAVFRDPSAWYHLVMNYDGSTLKLWINGEQLISTAMTGNTKLNNGSYVHYLSGTSKWDGYLADVYFIDGQALDADDFGELKNGVWVAKDYAGTYGTNGFYLDFANSADIGNDVSGEGNDWTPNNFTASDVVLDSPTDNFATLNPLASEGAILANGNLDWSTDTSGSDRTYSTIAMSSGKWYWEVTQTDPDRFGTGVVDISNISLPSVTSDIGTSVYEWGFITDGQKRNNSSASSYGSSIGNGGVLMVALDADNGELYFGKDGTWFNSSNPATNTSPAFDTLTSGGEFLVSVSRQTADNSATFEFGQGGFTYTPPTGYLALSTANLPDPAIDPAQGSSPEDYFNTVLYTGNGSTQSITVGFQPDFVWFKNRTTARHHAVYDAVRGATQNLTVSLTDAETTQSASLTSFDSDGFSIGSAVWLNQNTDSIVAWNWKANGSGVSNTDGTITSTVSANTESGFSIVSYTGTGASATVGHGLSAAPEFMIIKNRADATNWNVYTTVIDGSMDYIYLNLTTGAGNSSASVPTSSLLNLTASNDVNGSGDNMIAYCFHSVEGFSKFGSYTGNGSADGPFVYTGFQPSFIIVKRTNAAEDWFMYDNKRSASGGYNVLGERLKPNTADSGYTTSYVDFLSNGFKWRVSGTGQNGSGDSYIYMAFADDGGPFKYSRAR